jgi:Fe-S cluster biogenesis protein NfuA
MTVNEVKILAVPQTATTCEFKVDRPVYPNAAFYFANAKSAERSDLARRLFEIAGVSAVLIAHDQITVHKVSGEDWRKIGPSIGSAIREHLASNEPAVSDELRQSLPPAEEIRGKVQQVLDTDVNPAVASHGGNVQLVDVRENNISIRMGGGCQGCGMAHMTLRHGVETAIRRSVPEVGVIQDATDHASGRNPYFPSAQS